MSVTKKDIANTMEKWWFGTALFGLLALFLWFTGTAPFIIGMSVGAGLMSFTRLFWSSRGDQEGVNPE